MRLIDADELVKKLEKEADELIVFQDYSFEDGIESGLRIAMTMAKQVPTAEERQHGHWNNGYACSVCGDTYYCPHCGANA